VQTLLPTTQSSRCNNKVAIMTKKIKKISKVASNFHIET
jgi:predicted SPOUT superfamily RNA methylase MTH1